MQMGWIRKATCFLCLGLAAVVVAQVKTPSVLDRVQRVDDPELGELIRSTMEKRGNLNARETLDIIRKISLGYTQIKLLDQQIEQVSNKIEASAGPAEMRYELLLARTELEAKLTTQLADLRDVMGIVPKYPFDKQVVAGLHTRLRLNPIDEDRVYVLDSPDPGMEYWATTRFTPLGLMTQADALDLIRERLKDPGSLPIRVDILWRNNAAEGLRDKVIGLIREMGAAMQAEVDLSRNPFIGSGEAPFYLRQGKITAFYPAPVRRPDASSSISLVSGPVAPEDLEQHILWRITFQWNVPVTFRIEYDRASFDLAQRVAEQIGVIAKRLGVGELVGVKSILVDPLPEAVFLGQWRTAMKGEICELVIQPEGQSVLTMDSQSNWIGSGVTIKAPYLMTTREIIIDPQKVSDAGHRYVYRGQIDGEGNLVLDKGAIYPQGTFHLSGVTRIVFAKVQ
jgi:hypothetical protein